MRKHCPRQVSSNVRPDLFYSKLIGWNSFQELSSAELIVEKLGELPLALAQAAAFMVSTHRGFVWYLQKLESNIRGMLDTQYIGPYKNVNGFTCWKMSFDALQPDAAHLLRIYAFLSNENIPEELFTREINGMDWLGKGQ